MNPVLIWLSAGPWVFDLPVIEWMKQRSSVSAPRCGSRSLVILPVCPRGRKSHSGLTRLPFSPWKVTSLSCPGIGVSCRFTNSGLKSNVSTWLNAPVQKTISTRLAFGVKCGARGA